MKKVILQFITVLVAGCSISVNFAYGQQNIIDGKDDTHPEIKQQQYKPAKIFTFTATQMNGYNEIKWSAVLEEDTRRFIVEYSGDGINYQTAGEATPATGIYTLKHYTLDTRTFLYRIRMEKKDGKFFNTDPFLLSGEEVLPVKLYPTIVTANTVNLQMYLPVQRISIFSLDGKQVMAKDMGRLAGYTQLAIPVLNRGTYIITFYGNGWKSSDKFVVG